MLRDVGTRGFFARIDRWKRQHARVFQGTPTDRVDGAYYSTLRVEMRCMECGAKACVELCEGKESGPDPKFQMKGVNGFFTKSVNETPCTGARVFLRQRADERRRERERYARTRALRRDAGDGSQ